MILPAADQESTGSRLWGFYLGKTFQCNRPAGCADGETCAAFQCTDFPEASRHLVACRKWIFPPQSSWSQTPHLQLICNSHTSEADSVLSDAVPNKESELYSEQLVSLRLIVFD